MPNLDANCSDQTRGIQLCMPHASHVGLSHSRSGLRGPGNHLSFSSLFAGPTAVSVRSIGPPFAYYAPCCITRGFQSLGFNLTPLLGLDMPLSCLTQLAKGSITVP